MWSINTVNRHALVSKEVIVKQGDSKLCWNLTWSVVFKNFCTNIKNVMISDENVNFQYFLKNLVIWRCWVWILTWQTSTKTEMLLSLVTRHSPFATSLTSLTSRSHSVESNYSKHTVSQNFVICLPMTT